MVLCRSQSNFTIELYSTQNRQPTARKLDHDPAYFCALYLRRKRRRECSSFPRKRPQVRVPPSLLGPPRDCTEGFSPRGTSADSNIPLSPIFVMPAACFSAAGTNSGHTFLRALKTMADKCEPSVREPFDEPFLDSRRFHIASRWSSSMI